MPWFTPIFVHAPPPPPSTPPAIYRTYVPQPMIAPVFTPAPTPIVAAPPALERIVYLSRHRQRTVYQVLTVLAEQIGYRVDLNAPDMTIPGDSGIIWMSSPQQGTSALSDMIALGRSLGSLHSIVVDPATMTITLESTAS